ncbi:MAG: hypothetical protein KZQ90_00850 [Candidatus Thiodiazotropha sp. (ex Codakia rugifera)]|nr:hypothetical protein [Candidatus Thiodiazotropha sp. (ex Codakia rugifera)]
MYSQRIAILLLLFSLPLAADQTLLAIPTSQPPTIDGMADEPVWSEIKPVITRDAIAGIDIELRACYDKQHIYMLAVFPDATENRDHKPLQWNPEIELYGKGPQREDTIVLKWAISPRETDLSLSANTPYKADIWYWKSARTDPVGYADDKFQVYSAKKIAKSLPLLSKNGSRFYLIRRGDSGNSAFQNRMLVEYTGDQTHAYNIQKPGGSRSDILAKGVWAEGVWRVEFMRKLDTGHGDDVIFKPGEVYQFGVSRFEIAGRDPDPKIEIPLFGSGEIGESLKLGFSE